MASAFALSRPSRDTSLAMTALRELLGPDPREGDLLELLQRSNMDGGYYHRASGGYPYAYGSFGRYYGPRYGYDPVVGMGVGFLGGMLVADALFW